MRTLMIIGILALSVAVLRADAAGCVTQTIYLPTGGLTICTTCCTGSVCTTTCL